MDPGNDGQRSQGIYPRQECLCFLFKEYFVLDVWVDDAVLDVDAGHPEDVVLLQEKIQIYFPLSPTRCLVLHDAGDSPALDVDKINYLSVEQSTRFLFMQDLTKIDFIKDIFSKNPDIFNKKGKRMIVRGNVE